MSIYTECRLFFLATVRRFGGSSSVPTASPGVGTGLQLPLGQWLRARSQRTLDSGFRNYSVSNVGQEKKIFFFSFFF